MIFLKVKDSKFRKKYCKIEKHRQIKKYVLVNLLAHLVNKRFVNQKQQRILFLISKLNTKFLINKVKIVRRCILTNRNRRVLRNYNISHTIFRNLNQFGLVPGLKKSVW